MRGEVGELFCGKGQMRLVRINDLFVQNIKEGEVTSVTSVSLVALRKCLLSYKLAFTRLMRDPMGPHNERGDCLTYVGKRMIYNEGHG